MILFSISRFDGVGSLTNRKHLDDKHHCCAATETETEDRLHLRDGLEFSRVEAWYHFRPLL
jgi:hypothetical protein